MKGFLILIYVLFFSINLFAEGCRKDSDCRFDRICANGECVFHPVDETAKREEVRKEPDRELLELKSDLGHYKKGRVLSIVGMSISLPLAIGSFATGAFFYTKDEDKYKNIWIVNFSTGGVLAVLGIITSIALGHNHSKVSEYETKIMLREATSILSNDHFALHIPQPVFNKSEAGNYYGLQLSMDLF